MGRLHASGFLFVRFVLVLALWSFSASKANAFEKQWHLGLGAGVSVPSTAYDAAASVSLHGAYGISDVFDARLTATSALLHPSSEKGERNSLSLVTLGLVYKLDVIEWVPYCGARAGAYLFGSSPLAGFVRQGGSVGGMCGIDYSFTRSVAVGVEVAHDFLLPEGQLFSALLHAEYRWGF
ncbi:MAG: hypothetical protein QM756_41685 [Polyangiaceae bacterium]